MIIRGAGFIGGALVLVLAAVSCGDPRRGEPIAGPLELTDVSLQRGREVFDTHCYKCHLQGEGGMSPIINDKPLPRFLMKFQVRHGLGAMPAFPEDAIGDRELDDLLDYIVALRHHGSSQKSEAGGHKSEG
jgi:mono/diheme cytochrome c family protein